MTARNGEATGPVWIELPVFGIILKVDPSTGAGTLIRSNLKRHLDTPYWDEPDRAIDGIESLILAHACAGVDVTDPKYLEGIETAFEAVANRKESDA